MTDTIDGSDPRAITDEQWAQMGQLGKELRTFIVRRGRELGLPLDKAGTTLVLLLVHTAEPSWPALQLRNRLGDILDIAFELRSLGTLETLFGPALALNVPDPVSTNRDSGR